MKVAKLIATCFGIGYLQKGAGSAAALFCCLLWYAAKGAQYGVLIQAVLLLFVFVIGAWAATVVESDWGHDSNRVVIDEVLGMLMAVFLLPVHWQYPLAAFVLFRFFDIAKPLGIRKLETFPAGWGVMLDDLLAGVYSNVLLQLLVKSHLFT